MADPAPGREGAAVFADEIRRLEKLIRDIASPSGTQQFNAVPKLQEAILALQQQQVILGEQQTLLGEQQGVIAEQQLQLAGQQAQLTQLVGNINATLTAFIQNDVNAIVDAAVTARLAAPNITIGQSGGTVRIPALYTTDVTDSLRPRTVVWVDDQGLVGHT